MSQYFIYYTESQIVCLIIFSIILIHDLSRIDRQEKQIRFDYALVSFMLYFISDTCWAAIISGVIPRTALSATIANYFNNFFMALITYNWFMYVLSVEKVGKKYSPKQKLMFALPLIASAVVSLGLYGLRPDLMFGPDLSTTAMSTVMLVLVPIIYIVAILIYTVRKALEAKTREERSTHIRLGALPLAIVFGGLLQVIVLESVPIFCFSCSIIMIIFYIQSIESQVSLDPLTGLNNRGQLQRYVQQSSTLFREGLRTYVGMIDVNDFKKINDGHGHAEGDNALVMISASLRHAAGTAGFPVFISRYGGDEFVLIMHCSDRNGPEEMIRSVRRNIQERSVQAGLPYRITVAYGYDELSRRGEEFADCLRRADHNSYLDKNKQKEIKR